MASVESTVTADKMGFPRPRERRRWLGKHVVALPQYSVKITFLCRLPATKILSLSQQNRIFCGMDFRKECLPYNRAVFLHW
jgi:hypothetical protein